MSKTVLVLGATGYVGTRLVSELRKTQHTIRVAYRTRSKIEEKHWYGSENLEYVHVDVFKKATLLEACKGVDIVYYLVHSMVPKAKDFADMDNVAAENMIEVAEAQGVQLIVYLGGLGDDDPKLSKHLRSRIKVGQILQTGIVPTTILRAAIIIGSGSSSFEILRYLVERLPVMTTPRWVHTKNQPIGIRDVLGYLIGVIDTPGTWGKTLDIGGPDILTYEQLMQIYSDEAKLWKRLIIPVPVLSPKLSSYWVDLITPIDKSIARPLVEGLRNEVVMENYEIRDLIPQQLTPLREAVRRGLKEREFKISHTKQTQLRSEVPVEFSAAGDPDWAGGSFVYNRRAIRFKGDKNKVWEQINRIGGKNGWFYGNILWKILGILDEMIGGVGMRRGRQNPKKFEIGQVVDLWKVSELEEGRMVLLDAEMRIPGLASMKLEIHPTENKDEYILEQFAAFVPRGLGGLIYWQIFLPIHIIIFNGMLRGITKNAGVKILGKPVRLSKNIVFTNSSLT